MPAIPVGTKVNYEYHEGDHVPAFVVEYQEGKDEGDYRLGGFCNSAQKAEGQGDVFNLWSVLGSGQGSFQLRAKA